MKIGTTSEREWQISANNGVDARDLEVSVTQDLLPSLVASLCKSGYTFIRMQSDQHEVTK